jgi:hypothetical protein
MAGHDLRQRVEVSDDDRTVATAEVTTSEGSGGTARVSLHAEPGHITPGRRASLVDAVLASNPCRPHNDVRGDHPVRQPRRRPGQHETGQLIELYRRASCGPAPASSGGC